jgi:prepilin-type N-terminal cleavage/methylation domain-containing protein
VKATSADSFRHPGGFTLIEIIIALSLVAILVSASLPYLFDSFAEGAGEKASQSLAAKALAARALAIESGQGTNLPLSTNGTEGVPMPEGWTLRIKGLNDASFHDPERGRSWGFTRSGLCEPISVRIVRSGDEGKFIETTFDALTAQPVHDEP